MVFFELFTNVLWQCCGSAVNHLGLLCLDRVWVLFELELFIWDILDGDSLLWSWFLGAVEDLWDLDVQQAVRVTGLDALVLDTW